jgi:hypothetical protein
LIPHGHAYEWLVFGKGEAPHYRLNIVQRYGSALDKTSGKLGGDVGWTDKQDVRQRLNLRWGVMPFRLEFSQVELAHPHQYGMETDLAL